RWTRAPASARRRTSSSSRRSPPDGRECGAAGAEFDTRRNFGDEETAADNQQAQPRARDRGEANAQAAGPGREARSDQERRAREAGLARASERAARRRRSAADGRLTLYGSSESKGARESEPYPRRGRR